MNVRLGGTLALLITLSACTKAAYVADGPLARPLTQFNRIDVRAITNKAPAMPATSETPPPPADKFVQTFRLDLTNRLLRKKVLHYASGPMLILEAALLKYRCESRSPSYERDILVFQGTIEVEIALSDESGKRIGGGKAVMTAPGSTPELAMKEAQKKIVASIGDYIKKSARGSEPDPPGSDDP
ncbi:MAG TPA: hypothetical protein VNM14_06075 [Planctomycetota bacterium]|jgi:hypothetical protein|nr:hypothetical protein [Planctomycetota bacterium]